MKAKERASARNLRLQGYSMNYIQRKLRVSKSSVSRWVRDIELTTRQKKQLTQHGIQKDVIERRRTTRLKNENESRQKIVTSAQREIRRISRRELWLIGAVLYWAEGGKTLRGVVRFSNSDPEMIKIIMIFFRKVCQVPEEKFRGYIHIHPHLDYKKAEHYWSSMTGIPLERFYKTYRKMNKASQHKRDSVPFGTFDIYICDTRLFLKISGWIKGIYDGYHHLSSLTRVQ